MDDMDDMDGKTAEGSVDLSRAGYFTGLGPKKYCRLPPK